MIYKMYYCWVWVGIKLQSPTHSIWCETTIGACCLDYFSLIPIILSRTTRSVIYIISICLKIRCHDLTRSTKIYDLMTWPNFNLMYYCWVWVGIKLQSPTHSIWCETTIGACCLDYFNGNTTTMVAGHNQVVTKTLRLHL
jgi:hypothetical protein